MKSGSRNSSCLVKNNIAMINKQSRMICNGLIKKEYRFLNTVDYENKYIGILHFEKCIYQLIVRKVFD